MLFIESALDDAVLFEPLEPGRQRVRADARERAFEILELAASPEQQVAQYQDRPALADDVERAGDRTVHVVRRGHPPDIGGRGFRVNKFVVTCKMVITIYKGV